MKVTALAAICILATSRCYATGGDSYDYIAKLSETLDILPAKSLGTFPNRRVSHVPSTLVWIVPSDQVTVQGSLPVSVAVTAFEELIQIAALPLTLAVGSELALTVTTTLLVKSAD